MDKSARFFRVIPRRQPLFDIHHAIDSFVMRVQVEPGGGDTQAHNDHGSRLVISNPLRLGAFWPGLKLTGRVLAAGIWPRGF